MPSPLRLKVPDEFREPLVALARMSEQDVATLLSALRDTSPTLPSEDYIARVQSKMGGKPRNTAEVIAALSGLYVVRSDFGVSRSEVIDSVLVGLNSILREDQKLDAKETEQLRQRLQALLGLEKTLGVVANGGHLRVQHENVYQQARLFTDLRPVFQADPHERPLAGTIVHELKISFRHDGRRQEFYVAMDTDDIRDLRKILERAEAKAMSLQRVLEEVELPVLDVPE